MLRAVAGLALVPAAIYAAQMAANHRAGLPGGDTNGFQHWTVQAALPIALIGLVALSALQADGWRVPAVTAAIGAATLGLCTIVDKGGAGDLSTGWGAGALEWGIVVLLATARAYRRALTERVRGAGR